MYSKVIRGQLLSQFAESVRDLGYDPTDVYRHCALDPRILEEDRLVPSNQIAKMLASAVEVTGCEHFGLLCAKNMQVQDYGALGQLLRTAPTFGTAVNDYVEHLKVNSTEIRRDLTIDGDVAWISVHTVSGITPLPQQSQFAVAVNWRFNCLLTQWKWQPRFISFRFEAPKDAAYYRRYFSLPIQFSGEFDGVAFAAADLELELPESDPLIYRALTQYIRNLEEDIPEDFLDTIRSLVSRQLARGSCSIEDIAEFLPYETRAFQRRLRDRGTSYQEILDDIRFDKAIVYLRTSDMKVERISDVLGYKNSSNFSKAFKRRFGLSPIQWKKQHREC
ncbi:MAG: AraC family transcriptional regulator [Halioglobus sp.]